MMKNKLITTIILSLLISECFSYGCGNYQFENLPVTQSKLSGTLYQYFVQNNGHLTHTYLTHNSDTHYTGSMWAKSYYHNWHNGFEVDFNMELKDMTCKNCPWYDHFCWFHTKKCGGSGFSFVIQASGPQARGQSGAGNGYQGLSNVIAVEFDTWCHGSENDPNERHISIIAKSGRAYANEAYSMARLNNAPNFRDHKGENYLNNAKYTIKYVDWKLQVYINGALQLQTSQFNLGEKLGLQNQQPFYLGVIAANGEKTTTHIMRNWTIKRLIYTIMGGDQVKNYPTQIESSQQFKIPIYLFTGCRDNRYMPITGRDHHSQLSFQTENGYGSDCKLYGSEDGSRNYKDWNSPAYYMKFGCQTIGTKKLIIYFQNQRIGRAVINLVGGDLHSLLPSVSQYQQNGKTDQEFSFAVRAYDQALNLLEGNDLISKIKNSISVQWPNPSDSLNNHVVSYDQHSKVFKVTVFVNRVGKYTVNSQYFSSSAQFEIFMGDPSVETSYAYAYNQENDEALPAIIDAAQDRSKVKVYLADKHGFIIPMDNTLQQKIQLFMKFIENGNWKQVEISGSNYNNAYKEYTGIDTIYSGNVQFLATYDGQTLRCDRCAFKVNPSVPTFSKTQLKVPSNGKYVPVDQNVINQEIKNPFTFALQSFDEYDSQMQSFSHSEYTAQFKGPNMDEFGLCLQQSSHGVMVQMCSEKVEAYKNFIGGSYVLTLNHKSESKNFNIVLISDGSDEGAGNGPFDINNTELSWKKDQSSYPTGSSIEFVLKLNTNENLRFNQILDESKIQASFGDASKEEITFQKTATKGIFTGMVLFKSQGDKVSSITVDGQQVPRTLSISITPSEVKKITLDPLPQGTVLEQFYFTASFYDNFDQLTEPSNQNNFIIKYSNGQTTSVQGQQIGQGRYECSLVSQVPGQFEIKNSLLDRKYYGDMKQSLKNIRPKASILNSEKELGAGADIQFRVETGYEKQALTDLNAIDYFSLEYKLDGQSKAVNLVVQDDGSLKASIQATKTGRYNFYATYMNNQITCQICSISVVAGQPDPSKTVVHKEFNGQKVLVDMSQRIVFQHRKRIPIMYLTFFDSIGNQIQFDKSYKWRSQITTNKGNINQYNLIDHHEGNQIVFRLESDQYHDYNNLQAVNTAFIEFKATHPTQPEFKLRSDNVYLSGYEDNTPYSTLNPSSTSIQFDRSVKARVGDYKTIQLKLITSDGKINPKKYSNPTQSIKIISDSISEDSITKDTPVDSHFKNYQVQEATLEGTYIVSFQCTKSSNVNLKIAFQKMDSDDFVKSANAVNFNIIPVMVSELVIAPNQLNNCVAGTSKQVLFTPYDAFGNFMDKSTLGMVGLHVTPTLQSSVNIRFNGQYFVVQVGCVKTGRMCIKSSKSITSSFNSASVNVCFNVVPNRPSARTSRCFVDKPTFTVGESVRLMIKPYDNWGNEVAINTGDSSHASSKFTARYKYKFINNSMDPMKIDHSQNVYYDDKRLYMWGTYYFYCYYEGNAVINQQSMQGNAAAPSFMNTNMKLYDSFSNKWNQYNGVQFEHKKSSFPAVELIIQDQYNNPVSSWPGWSITAYLTGDEIAYERRIQLCKVNNYRFDLCKDDSLPSDQQGQDLQNSINRWNNLIPNKVYSLTLHNGSNGDKKVFKINITGQAIDSMASNLPMHVPNTIVNPASKITVIAGETAKFIIDIRTTNRNKRRNEWFTNVMESIKLTFTGESCDYLITTGDQKGKYEVSITPTLAEVNSVHIYIKNTLYTGYYPKLDVKPSAITQILYLKGTGQEILQEVPDLSVDLDFYAYFMAKDRYHNKVFLNNNSPLSFNLQRGGVPVETQKTILADGRIKIGTNSKIPGLYSLKFDPSDATYQFSLLQGALSPETCAATMPDEELPAGDETSISIIPKDQWGNVLVYDDELFSEVKDSLKYFYKEESKCPNCAFVQGNGQWSLHADKKSFYAKQQFTLAGNVEFQTSVKDSYSHMIQSVQTVKPNDNLTLNLSHLSGFNVDSSQFEKMSRSQAIFENNVYELPKYMLQIADSYGNIVRSVSAEDQNKFAFQLTGDSWTTENGILYEKVSMIGSNLVFAVRNDYDQRYKDGLWRPDPYTLTITYEDQSITYPILLQGTGSSDMDADIIKPLDYDNTVVSTNDIQVVAGETSSFKIECRTNVNTRKSDARPNWSFSFTQIDGLNDGNYQASVFDSDLRGLFRIVVTATKATNYIGDTTMEIFDGENLFKQKISIGVLPNVLTQVEMLSDLSVSQSADVNYEFIIIPQDRFKNTVDSSEPEINMEITWPRETDEVLYFVTENPSNNHLKYRVVSHTSGTYVIQSEMLDQSKNYQFVVVPGAPSPNFSTLEITPVQLEAGDTAFATVRPFDQYGNAIPTYRSDAAPAFTIQLVQEQEVTDVASMQVDTELNVLKAEWIFRKTGYAQIQAAVQQGYAICDNCNMKYLPAQIKMDLTQFSVQVDSNVFAVKPQLDVNYGSEDFQVSCEFYDKNSNMIEQFFEDDVFEAVLSGNNMVPMDLKVIKSLNHVSISLNEEDIEIFKYLVISEGYIITLKYRLHNVTEFTVDYPMLITGDPSRTDGAGNGPLDISNTKLSSTYLTVIAGTYQSVVVTLQTPHDMRFNGAVDMSQIATAEIGHSQSQENLKITLTQGEKIGDYVVSVYGEQALLNNDVKLLKVTLYGQPIAQTIKCDIIPNVPDFSKTVVVNGLEPSTMTDQNVAVQIQIFDQFNNKYDQPEFASQIVAYITAGQGSVLPTSVSNSGDYVIVCTPVYPPKEFGFTIYYLNENAEKILILPDPLSTIIKTEFSWKNTEIHGKEIIGGPVDRDLQYRVLLKDTKGYCFEEHREVSVQIMGPYLSDEVDDPEREIENQLVTVDADVQLSQDSSVLSGCNQFYVVNIPGGTLQKVGFYQTNVFIRGYNNGNPVVSVRKTRMTAGDTVPQKTILRIPTLFNRGNAPLVVPVNYEMTFHAFTADVFSNKVGEFRETDSLSFSIPFVGDEYYSSQVENFRNGTFKVSTTIFKTGSIRFVKGFNNGLEFIVNSEQLNFNELDIFDFPQLITVVPGACTTLNPLNNIDALFTDKNIPIGDQQKIEITCLDNWKNKVGRGGNSFTAQLFGSGLPIVGSDDIDLEINDLGNGNYQIIFTLAWPGKYDLSVQLDNEFYASHTVLATSSLCQSEAPFYCPNTKSCVSGSYLNCNLPEYSCESTDKPLRCSVNGVKDQCVTNKSECDCEEGFVKCVADNKCIEKSLAADLCSTVLENSCQDSNYPFLCADGSCRKNKQACPSQPGCPPGFRLCADQTCALECDNGVFSKCPDDKMYKCEDQTCAPTPQACRSRITCNQADMVVCPDQTCALSELQCRQPFKCNSDMYLCPDQSCAPTVEDCPSAISCPVNYSRCEDNSCLTDCSNVLKNSPVQVLQQRRRLSSSNASEALSGSCGDQIVCPGGECASSIFMCSTIDSCPLDTVRCPDYSCAASKDACVVKICREGQFHCWDGKCVENKDQCSTRTSCPEKQPVKCPQGNCVESLQLCKSVISCPSNSPYKCANGECRANESDCPTFITCPPNRPIKCQDQSCQKSKKYCNQITPGMECAQDQIICPDGSCALSMILCPTTKSCNLDQIRCWDNTCEKSLDDCPVISQDDETNPSNAPIRCSDGSTRQSIMDCPTQIICPEQFPIRCEDGTCKESNSQCFQNSQCSFGLIKCPDGSCTLQNCGTPITCSIEAPYYCHDNTCKRNPADCPKMPTCSETAPILCPDGTCVSQRVNCKGFETCPLDKPVRCPDMNCYSSHAECVEIKGCPPGRLLCGDGSCSSDIKLCPKQECPSHLPHQCLDGFCVNEAKYCDLENGCPYDKPHKCKDGSCSGRESECDANVECENGQLLCPDGSCSLDVASCPNEVGCPVETPHKCSSGECINLENQECDIAICPSHSPIKCLDGLCVESTSSCPSFINIQENQECLGNRDGNIVPCADGRCVASSDQCRPVYACGNNQIRCQDGSCRPLLSLCPKMQSKCPSNKPYMCLIGACSSVSSECPTTNGCPFSTPVKCEKAGTCAETNEKCEETYSNTVLPNNCKFTEPFKCDDGSCVSDKSQCVKSNGCAPSTPVRCIDGTCVSDVEVCLSVSLICGINQVQCPDKSCKSSWNECKLTNGCSVQQPHKCADGSCAATPLGENGCAPTIKCPDYKPFLCSDGECVGDLGHCRVQLACPSSNPIRCPNLSCVDDFNKCSEIKQCPITSPILCDSGTCVKTILECRQDKQMYCPANAPIKCVSGECKAFPGLCQASLFQSSQSRRVLENSIVDQGCSEELPYRCYDGGCRASIDDCQILPACSNPSKPYRCQTGICAQNQYHCADDAKLAPCSESLKRCEDGICRQQCPQFNGCPLSTPFNCANGFCATSLAECAGGSNCPITSPFRCADNSCVTKMELCQVPLRLNPSEKFFSTISHLSSSNIDFIQSEDSQIKYAKLFIPAGALLNPLSDQSRRILEDDQNSIVDDSSQILISPISSSAIEDTTAKINNERYDYIRKFFPTCFGDLKYTEAVRSPVFKITSVDRETAKNYRFPMQINLKADMPVDSDKNTDYCLGRLDEQTRQWSCSSRLLMTKESYASNEFSYPFNQDGVYSILFNPDLLPDENVAEPCLFFCQHKWTIFYSVLGTLCAILIIGYIMWRVSRYMTKYRQAKKQMDNYREQINELEKTKTQVVGMSMKDKMQGIVFNSNPLVEQDSVSEIANEDSNAERYEELELMVERMSIREKMLTQVNSELQNRNKLLNMEYEELTKKVGNRQQEISLLSLDNEDE